MIVRQELFLEIDLEIDNIGAIKAVRLVLFFSSVFAIRPDNEMDACIIDCFQRGVVDNCYRWTKCHYDCIYILFRF